MYLNELTHIYEVFKMVH